MNLTWMKTTFSMAQPSLERGKHPSSQVFYVCVCNFTMSWFPLSEGWKTKPVISDGISQPLLQHSKNENPNE